MKSTVLASGDSEPETRWRAGANIAFCSESKVHNGAGIGARLTIAMAILSVAR